MFFLFIYNNTIYYVYRYRDRGGVGLPDIVHAQLAVHHRDGVQRHREDCHQLLPADVFAWGTQLLLQPVWYDFMMLIHFLCPYY